MRCTILSWACLSLLVPAAAPAQDAEGAFDRLARPRTLEEAYGQPALSVEAGVKPNVP